MAKRPYQTEFPRDEIMDNVIPLLRGRAPDNTFDAVHDGLTVLDYCTYMTKQASGSITPSALDEMSVAAMLEEYCRPNAIVAQTMPWGRLVKLLLPLIMELISKQ